MLASRLSPPVQGVDVEVVAAEATATALVAT